MGFFGLNLAQLFEAEGLAAIAAPAAAVKQPIKSCILMFYYGGPSHHDTWDMKLSAPAEVRGDFKPIATSVPGVPLCEHLPHTAKIMDRLAVIRSAHHTMRNHNSAAVEALCGAHAAQGRPGTAVERSDHRLPLLRLGADLSERQRSRWCRRTWPCRT